MRFPVMIDDWRKPRVSIPWEAIAPYNEMAKTNHCEQDLVRLAERGGLSYSEIGLIITGTKYKFGYDLVKYAQIGKDWVDKINEAR